MLGPNRRDEAVDDCRLTTTACHVAVRTCWQLIQPPNPLRLQTCWQLIPPPDPLRLTLPRSHHRTCKFCHGPASSTPPCGSRKAPGIRRFGNTASQFGMRGRGHHRKRTARSSREKPFFALSRDRTTRHVPFLHLKNIFCSICPVHIPWDTDAFVDSLGSHKWSRRSRQSRSCSPPAV